MADPASKPLIAPHRAVMAVFFTQAFAAGNFFPRIPDIQASLGLSEAELGVTLISQPVGGLVMVIFAGWLIERFGTRALLLLGIPFIALATFASALAPGAAVLFAALFVATASYTIADVTMNIEADRIEAATGRRIMNRCHGMWSLGMLVSSLIGAGARGLGISPTLHFALMLPLVFAAVALIIWPLRPAAPRAHRAGDRRKVFAVPTLATLALVGFGLAGVVIEISTRTWSVIYMRDSFSAPEWVEALTLPAFLFTLFVGRMLGDRMVEAFGAVRVAATLMGVALLGVGLVVTAQTLAQALIGFGMMGYGVCVSFPLMVSAAARIGDRPASENVTAVTMTISIVLLGAPAAMGYAAEGWGIRMSFALLIPFVAIALILVRHIDPNHGTVEEEMPIP